MRRTHAPSQGFKSSFMKTEYKTFSQATRTTSDLLKLLSNDSSENSTEAFSLPPPCAVANLKPAEDVSYTNQKINMETQSYKISCNVVWSKQTKKKHKTWEGDGILEVTNESAVLRNTNGVVLGRSSKVKHPIEQGCQLFVGSKLVEIISIVTKKTIVPAYKSVSSETIAETKCQMNSLFMRPKKRVKLDSRFSVPLPGANNELLVMPRPNYTHQVKYNLSNLPIHDVKLDLFLSRILRDHQKEGILFLYSCITGIRDVKFNGAILADEMGLGKTLQCISLIWMILKSGPYEGIPLVQRILIVTPSSLVTNWMKEFKKWLGLERVRPYVVNQKQKMCGFVKSPASLRPILIISYEMLLKNIEELKRCKFQLLICDEGHRLKNSQIQISQALLQLAIDRKVILTGTPVQNNLQEFYALIDFVNTGILGTYSEFRKYFEIPIVQSNQSNCSIDDKELGKQRANELNHRTNSFILRRTQCVIDKYLPSKQECVIFCSPTQLQTELYRTVVSFCDNNHDTVPKIPPLAVITILKKICNDPRLIRFSRREKSSGFYDENEDVDSSSFAEELQVRLQSIFEKFDFSEADSTCSGKMLVLEKLLKELQVSKERIVLISYFTQTLDLLQDVCLMKNYSFLRLDGNTASSVRSDIVDKFNASDSKYFIFLLSAKAGGLGLNLIGASRLILFDLDWNPASDVQAMSRIWRDGQQRNVYLYRFVTAGSIEEKMYQRQISKTGLSDAVVDINNTSRAHLSAEELKDLFIFKPECNSLTHELLCDCEGCGIPENGSNYGENTKEERTFQLGIHNQNYKNKNDLKISELLEWEHYSTPVAEHVLTELCLESASDFISFVFRNKNSNWEKRQFDCSMTPCMK